MVFRLSLLFRLLAAPSLCAVMVAFPLAAYAQDDEEEEGGDEEGGEEGEEGDDEDKEDKDQPPVTAGGLYTLDTYPQSEVERPLTITQNILEVRAGLGFDLSKDVTFETWGMFIDLRYGLRDNIELEAGTNITLVAPEGFPKPVALYGAIDMAIVYDLVDFRAGVGLVLPGVEDADPQFDLFIGFPFKYRLKPNIAIIALDKLFTVHTDGRKPDLTIGVGGVFQVIDMFAVIGRAELVLPEFEPDVIAIPATIGVQLSPSGKIDFGLEFQLGNLKAPEGGSPFDSRALFIFGRARFGK